MFKNHPKGLLAAALSNMGERFGYYIMNAVLLLFLVSKFGLSDATSGVIYSVRVAALVHLWGPASDSFWERTFQGESSGHCWSDVRQPGRGNRTAESARLG